MSARRQPVSEARWREIKNELVQRVSDQQRSFGALPSVRKTEQLITPILRKVEVKRASAPAIVKPAPRKMPAPLEGRGIDARGMAVDIKPVDVAGLDRMRKKHKPTEWRKIRDRIRQLLKFPEWRAKISDTIFGKTAPDMKPSQRIEAWLKIYEDSCKVFGDPLKPFEAKVIVG